MHHRLLQIECHSHPQLLKDFPEFPIISQAKLKIPRGPDERDFRYAPTSHGESSKCKEIFFYCNSLAPLNPFGSTKPNLTGRANPAASRGKCARYAFS